MTRRVRAFVPDLMDRSRLRAPGVEVGFVADPATLLEESAELYVVDLARTGVLEALGGRPGAGARLVGFAPVTPWQGEPASTIMAVTVSPPVARASDASTSW